MSAVYRRSRDAGWRWMLIGCVVAVGLGIAGCATTQSDKQDSLTKNGETDPSFFDEIPADTLYLVASLDAGSEEMKSYTVSSGSGSFMSMWQSFVDDAAEEELEQYPVLDAFVEEFKEVDSLEAYRELGLEPLAPSAVYALGGLPVGRAHLSDAKKFQEFVGRFESEAELDVNVVEHNGNDVHIYSPEAMVEQSYDREKGEMVEEFRFHIAMTVRDGQVVVAAYPTGVKEQILDHVTGKTTPDDAMGDASAVRNLNRKYGYESFMQSGWVDMQAIAKVLTEQTEPTELGSQVMEIMDVETVSLDETCQKEVSTLIEQVPRFVAGTETFSRKELAVSAGFEVTSDMSQQLGELGAPIPAYGSEMYNRSWVSVGMGINVEKYVDFGMDQASQVVNDPYQCEYLEGMNQVAKRMTQVSGMVPPALRQVKAGSLILSEFALSDRGMRPETLKGLALIRARNPSSILAQLRTFVPGLAELSIKSNGVPVALEQVVRRTPNVDAAHLAYTDEYLGASIGMGTQDALAEFLESPSAEADSPLLSFGMDLGRIGGVISDRLEKMLESGQGDGDTSKKMDPEEQLGMSFLELDANENGVFVSYRVNTPGGGSEASSSE